MFCALMVRKLLNRRIIQGSANSYLTYQPFAHIIVPVKGTDDDLVANVSNLCSQEYPNYRIVFVVESVDDPAHSAISDLIDKQSGIDTRLIVAGLSDGRQGQKVHNQLQALAAIDGECSDDDVWVFADSDAVPSDQWLRRLVGPLSVKDTIGATSGYRWFCPDADRPDSIWTHVASVINSSVASFCGRPQFNRAWGGSMAVRVSTAREGRFQDMLNGALTDDYQLTRMVGAMGLTVHFVPEAVVPSPVSFDWPSVSNFIRRQYLITRVYQPTDYLAALSLTGLYTLASWSAMALLIASLFVAIPPVVTIAAIAAMGWVFIANQLRATFRSSIIECLFDAETVGRMRLTRRIDRWWTTGWMALHFLLIASTAFKRQMTWRDIRYRIRGRQDVQVISTKSSEG